MNKTQYCIYIHTDPSGKSYIGQTNNFARRNTQHKHKKGRALSSAIKKYGWDAFTHEILVDGLTLDEANDRESYFIELHGTLAPNGYNLMTGGGNASHTPETCLKIGATHKGKIVSKETREKQSNSHKGHILSIDTRAKLSIAGMDKTPTEETRTKISAANKGKVFSKDHRENLRKSHIGSTPTDEARANMSAAKRGRTHSTETREKISASNKGHNISSETREKIGAANKGRVHSPEIIAKMVAAQKKRRENESHRKSNLISA